MPVTARAAAAAAPHVPTAPPGGAAGALRAMARRVLPPMSPEESFLVLVCRQRLSADAAERARARIDAGLRWERVLALAHRGQVGPLLHRGLVQLGPGAAVPSGFRARAQALYAANWGRSRRLAELLEQVVESCAAEGIELLAHKGAALALGVFDDPVLRVAGDLDLSVRDAERARAERATHDVRRALVAANPDRRDPAGFHVELDGTAHHDLDASRHGRGRWSALPLDWDALWERSERVAVGRRTVRVPCTTDLVLTLVANAIRRGFTPLRLVSDVAETVDVLGDRIAWPELRAELARTRLDRRAWIPLGLAAAWFDAAVPAELLEPPPGLRLLPHERVILAVKRRRPTWRVPSRVLWAGGTTAAAATAARLGATLALRRVPSTRVPRRPGSPA